jgi:hypothetical protein
MSDNPATPPKEDWREMRREERQARREMRRSGFGGPAVGGLVLLAIGLVLLAGNFGLNLPDHWWAAFLLIPAGAALVNAIRLYNVNGQISGPVIGSLLGGLFFLALAAALFFDFDWKWFAPIILILIGIALIGRNYWPRGN